MTDEFFSPDRVNKLRRQDGSVHGGDCLLPRHPAGQEEEEGYEQGEIVWGLFEQLGSVN